MTDLHVMHGMFGRFVLGVTGLAVAGMGCQANTQRLNAPPQGPAQYSHELQDPMMTMTDNALLEDMSVAPVHFVPRTDELNGTGARRLKRMANILKVYGGTVNYTGYRDNKELVSKRMAKIREFLLAEGLDRDSFKVAQGLPGGEGMAATEAVAVRMGSRYNAQGSSCGSSGSESSVSSDSSTESK